jgi:hypothetical protein
MKTTGVSPCPVLGRGCDPASNALLYYAVDKKILLGNENNGSVTLPCPAHVALLVLLKKHNNAAQKTECCTAN